MIQRRQVLLVQVVKEERGNKGAALTTYLSLAGRYCVLMPNTSHGGGISRKISNGADRKRLKQIMSDLSLPKSMGLIVRTAGLSRTKTEIKRDFDYLARLWDEIRERTLGSTAPALIYRDSDLIKRAIRDLYHREIEEVIVEGEEGYKAARGFMKLLMPSHVRRVKLHSETTPLFQRYGVEDQLSAMYQPLVQLKSGGYLVINPTEALVSIDINSGRSTREHNIEQTAYSTNIEAAAEIARQLRLRDMAGLVVIDFIDMEQSGHVRKVEKAMKDALKNDRARIQVGRISSFGLMEMSRQRLRTGVLEASTKPCQHCEGTGLMRTAASAGLSALRIIEDEADTRPRREDLPARRQGSRRLRAQQEARRACRHRAALRRVDRHPDRRKPRRRADDGRKLGPPAGRRSRGRSSRRRSRKTSRKSTHCSRTTRTRSTKRKAKATTMPSRGASAPTSMVAIARAVAGAVAGAADGDASARVTRPSLAAKVTRPRQAVAHAEQQEPAAEVEPREDEAAPTRSRRRRRGRKGGSGEGSPMNRRTKPSRPTARRWSSGRLMRSRQSPRLSRPRSLPQPRRPSAAARAKPHRWPKSP